MTETQPETAQNHRRGYALLRAIQSLQNPVAVELLDPGLCDYIESMMKVSPPRSVDGRV